MKKILLDKLTQMRRADFKDQNRFGGILKKFRKIHMVGIAGAGMRGLAEVLIRMGVEVSGSDTGGESGLAALKNAGAKVSGSHRADNVCGCRAVVISSAIPDSNPEILRARKEGIPVIRRAEMLAEIMKTKFGVAVMGSHGKTTAASMTASVLKHAGLDPTVVVGGKVASLGSGRCGGGDVMVAEADESDGSFRSLCPMICVLTNVDREHLDYYGTLENLRAAFGEFLERTPSGGLCVLCADCPQIRKIIPCLSKKIVTYGILAEADFRLKNFKPRGLQSSFDIFFKNKNLGSVSLPAAGRHNAVNSLAAAAVGMEMGVSFDLIRAALENFGGIERRMQLRGEAGGVSFIDDYGHHPEEIRAVLRAVREAFSRHPVVIFQPHRFSRTHLLFDDFVDVLSEIRRLYILDVFPAGERPIKGAASREMAKSINASGRGHAVYARSCGDLVACLKRDLSEGDIVLTLGAGDVWRCAEALENELA